MTDVELIEALGWSPCGGRDRCITHASPFHHDNVCLVMNNRLLGARDGMDLVRRLREDHDTEEWEL